MNRPSFRSSFLAAVIALFMQIFTANTAHSFGSVEEYQNHISYNGGPEYWGSLFHCLGNSKWLDPITMLNYYNTYLPNNEAEILSGKDSRNTGTIAWDYTSASYTYQNSISALYTGMTMSFSYAATYVTALAALTPALIFANPIFANYLDICGNVYIVQPHEYVNYINGWNSSDNKGSVPSDHPCAITAAEVPYFFQCTNPSGIGYGGEDLCQGYQNNDNCNCTQEGNIWKLPANHCYAQPGMVGQVIVSYDPYWLLRMYGMPRTQFAKTASAGGLAVAVNKVAPSDAGYAGAAGIVALNPSQYSTRSVTYLPTMVYLYSYYKIDPAQSGALVACVAAPRTYPPLNIGCATVSPPRAMPAPSEPDYIANTRCHYILNARSDLTFLASTLDPNVGLPTIRFLQGSMHLFSNIVGCSKDLLMNAVAGQSYVDSKGVSHTVNGFFADMSSATRGFISSILLLYLCLVAMKILLEGESITAAQYTMFLVRFGVVLYFTNPNSWYQGSGPSATGILPALVYGAEEVGNLFADAVNQNDAAGMCRYNYDPDGGDLLKERLITNLMGTQTPYCSTGSFDGSSMSCATAPVSCPGTGSIDTTSGICSYPASCSTGSYNSSIGACITTAPTSTCSGAGRSISGANCVYNVCGAGQVYSGGNCYSCNSGDSAPSLLLSGNSCQHPASSCNGNLAINGTCSQCASGTTYSAGSCLYNPSCASGATLSNGMCYSCSSGTYISSGNTCQTSGTPSNCSGYLDQNSGMCCDICRNVSNDNGVNYTSSPTCNNAVSFSQGMCVVPANQVCQDTNSCGNSHCYDFNITSGYYTCVRCYYFPPKYCARSRYSDKIEVKAWTPKYSTNACSYVANSSYNSISGNCETQPSSNDNVCSSFPGSTFSNNRCIYNDVSLLITSSACGSNSYDSTTQKCSTSPTSSYNVCGTGTSYQSGNCLYSASSNAAASCSGTLDASANCAVPLCSTGTYNSLISSCITSQVSPSCTSGGTLRGNTCSLRVCPNGVYSAQKASCIGVATPTCNSGYMLSKAGCITSADYTTRGFGGIKLGLWDLLDCKLMNYLNLGLCNYNIGGMVAVWLISIAFIAFVTLFSTAFLMFAITMFVYAYLMALMVFKIAHIAILCAIMIGVLVVLAPLFISFLLFEKTQGITMEWARKLLGYMLFPAMLVAGMCMMIAALDYIYYGADVIDYMIKHPTYTYSDRIDAIDTACHNNLGGLFCDIRQNLRDTCQIPIGKSVNSLLTTQSNTILGVFTISAKVLSPSVLGASIDSLAKMMVCCWLFYFFIDTMTSIAGSLTGVQGIAEAARGQVNLLSMATQGFKMTFGKALGALRKKGENQRKMPPPPPKKGGGGQRANPSDKPGGKP